MVASLSHRFSRTLDLAARICFALAIIFTPLRWRIVLWERPTFPVYGDFTNFLLYASDIALFYTFVFWGSSLFLNPRRISFGSASIWVSLVGLTLAGFVSSLASEDSLLSRYHFLRLLFLFLFYLFIVNEVRSLAWVLLPVGVQVLLQSAIAIGQSLLQHSLGLRSAGELLLDPQNAGVSVVFANGLRFLRAYGLTDHPNILGGCLAFGLVLLLATILYGRTEIRLLTIAVFLIVLLALVMTFSRSAWISFLVGSSSMVGMEAVLRHWGSVRRAAVIGLASIIVATPFILLNAQFFGVRFNVGGSFRQASMENQSLGERLLLIRSATQIFVEHSATGIGLGASPLALKRRFPDFQTNYQPPHDTLIATAMETGVVGATFYFLLMITPVIVFIWKWKSLAGEPYITSVFALILTVMIVGFFDYYTWLNAAGRVWQWLAWGLWSSQLMKVA